MTINSSMLENMEKALSDLYDERNPFFRDGDATYMRYDEIQVSQSDGLVSVKYRWRGVTICTIQSGCDFAAGEVLTLTGNSGRMLVRMTQA